MLPEVEEYLTEKNTAEKAHEEWYRKINSERPLWHSSGYTDQAYRDWQERYETESRKQSAEMNKRTRLAYTKMMEVTSDPMIKWMVENIRSYTSYIDTVLPILPATREQLEILANEHDWCSEFDGFLQQATEAGVVPPAEDKNDISKILTWIGEEFDVYGRQHRRRVQILVNEIVTKAVQEERARIMVGERNLMDHVPLTEVLS